MPNVVRTLHKAEIVRRYIHACNQQNYTPENGRPSERTIWNLLNSCPSSQRKSLAGLDNIASEGSDAYDAIISILSEIDGDASKKLEQDMRQSKRYLKGDYKCHVAEACDGVPDHCRIYALSDPVDTDFQGLSSIYDRFLKYLEIVSVFFTSNLIYTCQLGPKIRNVGLRLYRP